MSEDIPEYDKRRLTEEDIEIFYTNPVKHKLVNEILNSIYAVGESDRWHCSSCKDHGDKWGMMSHDCKALRKQKPEKIKEENDLDQCTLD